MPYAGTGCGAHDNHRIHTQEIQGLGQMGPEEVGSIFFMDNRLLRARFQLGVDFQPFGIDIQGAHKAAFEVIKAAMDGSGQAQEKKGTIILATVKGDIHDIGKNIVKVLLENYSYEVIDLGRDVPPEVIVKEAVERQVALVGLSALMTTTVPSMEETIRQLRAASVTVKVMVGGAVLIPIIDTAVLMFVNVTHKKLTDETIMPSIMLCGSFTFRLQFVCTRIARENSVKL